MSRCRRTDAILDIAADPALGVEALTDRHWDHIGVCADCTVAVRGIQRLDTALSAVLRSLPHEDLPPSVLDTPPIPRSAEPVQFAPLLAAAAVVVLAVGAAFAGVEWLGLRGLGVGEGPSPVPTSPASTPSAPPPSTPPAASPSTVPSPSATPGPTAVTDVALTVGELAAVVDDDLVVRTAPGTDPDSTILPDRLWTGQRVRILDGPADVDSYTWWEVQVGEVRGWVADGEADDSAPWLAPIVNGEIHFWRYPGDDAGAAAPELFSIAPDGSDERELGDPTAAHLRLAVSCGAGVGQLAWRHDGAFAAFEYSAGGCERETYLMAGDGSETRLLADGWAPAWRPDGTMIAYAPNAPYLELPERGAGEVMAVAPDGGAPRRLTDSGERLAAGFPAWAPDRQRVAYSGGIAAEDDQTVWRYRVYVTDPGGTSARAIADGMRPTWSPDGRWIVYETTVDDEASSVELWRVRPDGSQAGRLVEGSTAAYSPDGARIAFVRPDGLWTIAADGSDESLVVPATVVDGFAWSPDGDALVVASNHADDRTIGVSTVRLDLRTPAITGLAEGGRMPSWRPRLADPRLTN